MKYIGVINNKGMLKKIIILSIVCALSHYFSIVAQNVNPSPNASLSVVANSDFVLMDEGVTETINVLNNDAGLLSGVKELIVIESSVNAEVKVEDMMILYTPNVGFVGDDEFKYRVCNNNGECGEATVVVIVEDVDFVPVANDDYVELDFKEYVNVNILSNDEGLNDLPVGISILRDLNHGYSSIEADNSIYLAFEERCEKDSLLYEICDVDGDCVQAWLFVQFQGADSQKVFIPQGISPNGDGINDLFIVEDFQGYNLKINIYNSAGSIVYKELDYKNNWDGHANVGKNNGQILPKGIYYYMIKVDELNKEFTGFVYLN